MKRPVIEVTLSDADGRILHQETRSAFNAGVRATEGLVRERAREARTMYVGSLPQRVGGVYRRTWTAEKGRGTLVATVAERIDA